MHSGSPRPRPALRRILVVALLFVVLAAACGKSDDNGSAGSSTPGSASSSSPVTVRLGYFPNVTHAPALVGVQEGFFKAKLEANGDQLATSTFNAGPEEVEALFADALDVGYIGPNPAINAYQKSNGEAVRIISGSTSGGASLVVQPDINGAADLEGKSVASPQLGGTQDVALRSWLKEQGLSSDTSGGGDVSIQPQANADTLTAFKSGDLAGAWVPEPWATRLVQEGGGKVLVDEATLWPQGQFVTTQIVVRTKFLDEHPDAVKAVLEAHLQSLDFIRTNPADAQKAANAEIEAVTQKALSDQVIAASWKNLTFTADPIATSLDKSAQDAVAVGLLEPIDLEGIYDLDLLNGLLVAGGKAEVNAL